MLRFFICTDIFTLFCTLMLVCLWYIRGLSYHSKYYEFILGVFVWEIDKWGHDIDTRSDDFHQKLVEFDSAIDSLLDQLEQQFLRDKVNIVIFSDHGMKDISPERTVDISHILNTTDVKIFTDRGHMCNIWPHDHKLEKVR